MAENTTVKATYDDSGTMNYRQWWTTTYEDETCPGCRGARVQQNNDGINVICPVCGGTGKFTPGIKITCTPTVTNEPGMAYPPNAWYVVTTDTFIVPKVNYAEC